MHADTTSIRTECGRTVGWRIRVGRGPRRHRPRDGLRPVPIDDEVVDTLRQRYPFFRAVLVLAGGFQGYPTPLKTVGIESVLLCRDLLAPDFVRQLAADWFVALDQLLKAGELPQAFTRNAQATPIPLHQGARDYNRARQVLLQD